MTDGTMLQQAMEDIEAMRDQLANIEQGAMTRMQVIVQDYWAYITEQNRARKEPSASRAVPQSEAPTPLSLSVHNKGGRLYVSWVNQRPGPRGSVRKGYAPVKQHIKKGRDAFTYSEGSLRPYMRGWERDIVMNTEAELGRLRHLIATATKAREALERGPARD